MDLLLQQESPRTSIEFFSGGNEMREGGKKDRRGAVRRMNHAMKESSSRRFSPSHRRRCDGCCWYADKSERFAKTEVAMVGAVS